MTRINSAIPVEYLTDEHLLAEHREIKRLPSVLSKTNRQTTKVPVKFCLGPGHIKFFLNKMGFIFDRYLRLYKECKRRGFDVQYYGDNWFRNDDICKPFWHGYKPTAEEKKLLIDRISLRINESSKPCFHYYGKPISKLEAIKLLTQDEQHFGTS